MSDKKVLIIDDDRSLLKILEKELTEFGFQIVSVQEPLKGVECVKREKPDIVILDIIMPGMSGYELLEQLKTDPLTKDIPVMMLTGKTMEADVERGLKMGVDDYISKPPQIDLLVKRMERLLL